ncbi:MAG: hypothetical protein Q8O38_09985 [Sulfurimicrobium sp.]|nr:hypothetical protein [Sulfurimicrobium sp.]
MRKMIVAACVAPLILSGCTGFVQMMPRDSGKVYSGTVQGSATGAGTMTITIDGEQFTGPVVRTGSSDSFGVIQQYGAKTGVMTGTVVSAGGTASVKAILSSPAGRGLRCEFTSDGSGGGGVCVDDKGRVLDAIVGR